MEKVSIVTVCFNSSVTIRDTIESVLFQDYSCIEYIIVDGASTDGTMDVVREYGDKINVVISEPDQGIYHAMNKGIKAATGDVIGLLNSDDFYADKSAVSCLMSKMGSAGADSVFADLVMVDSQNINRIMRYYKSSSFNPERLAYGWMPAHPTFMVKRDLYVKHGGYELDYRIAADFEMIARLLYKVGASYVYLPKVVIKMRVGGVSTRGVKSSWILNNEIIRACRANGIKTNLLKVLLKLPLKTMEYIRRPR